MQAQVDGQGSVLIRQHVKCRSVGNNFEACLCVYDIKGVLQTTLSEHASMSATISTMGTRIEGLTGDVSGLMCQLSDAYTILKVANCKLEAAKAVFNTPKSSRPSGDVSNGTLVGAQLFGESTGNATPHGVELASHQSPPSHQLPQSSSHQRPMSPTLPQRHVPQTVETLPAAHLSPQLQPTLKHPPLESQPTAPPQVVDCL